MYGLAIIVVKAHFLEYLKMAHIMTKGYGNGVNTALALDPTYKHRGQWYYELSKKTSMCKIYLTQESQLLWVGLQKWT